MRLWGQALLVPANATNRSRYRNRSRRNHLENLQRQAEVWTFGRFVAVAVRSRSASASFASGDRSAQPNRVAVPSSGAALAASAAPSAFGDRPSQAATA